VDEDEGLSRKPKAGNGARPGVACSRREGRGFVGWQLYQMFNMRLPGMTQDSLANRDVRESKHLGTLAGATCCRLVELPT
jgi:hypothetical protein